MSEPATDSSTVPTAARPTQASVGALAPSYVSRPWKIGSVAVVIMIVLVLVGVGLTNMSSSIAPSYWIWLVPVFGLLCVITAWARTRHDPQARRPGVLRQVFHWLGIAFALQMDFVISGTGQETRIASGYNALLLLALGCYLAGVHLEWLFVFVGVLLTVTLYIVATAQEYIWLIFVAGGAIIAALIVVRWRLGKRRAGQSLAAARTGS